MCACTVVRKYRFGGILATFRNDINLTWLILAVDTWTAACTGHLAQKYFAGYAASDSEFTEIFPLAVERHGRYLRNERARGKRLTARQAQRESPIHKDIFLDIIMYDIKVFKSDVRMTNSCHHEIIKKPRVFSKNSFLKIRFHLKMNRKHT